MRPRLITDPRPTLPRRTKVTVLCTEELHPIRRHIKNWLARRTADIDCDLVSHPGELRGGDFLFLLSCHDFVSKAKRDCYAHTLVVHASDLPMGRGWSPHIWQILEGAEQVTLSLLEAADPVDTGDLWSQAVVQVPRHAVSHEISDLVCRATVKLLDFAIDERDSVVIRPQRSDIAATYHPRRSPEDSKLDPDKSIAEQFNLLRVSDPDRYPAYFELHGYRYIIRLEKQECQNEST